MYLRTCFFIACLTLTATAHLQARTWTDQQGRSMEAEVIRVQNGTVSFQKKNGMRYPFALADLSQADQDYLIEWSRQNSTPESQTTTEMPQPTIKAPTALTSWLEKNLIARKGKRVARARESRIPQADYIALYFSASWCPPCRKFTPQLVDFYNQRSPLDKNFEIVFVSSDRDDDSQESYILDDEMPWPAVEFDEVTHRNVQKYAGNGIPCLVLIDREGEIIQHSYVNGQYKGPTSVMKKLGELLD